MPHSLPWIVLSVMGFSFVDVELLLRISCVAPCKNFALSKMLSVLSRFHPTIRVCRSRGMMAWMAISSASFVVVTLVPIDERREGDDAQVLRGAHAGPSR